MTDVSIVIPAFNEAERLPATVKDLVAFLSKQPWSWEIVVSDDGSVDGTPELFAEHRVVRSPTNRGKGHAVRLGMLAARGAVRVMCDADGSMPPAELPLLVEPVARGEVDIAAGSRYVGAGRSEGQPRVRRAWSRLAHRITASLVPGIRDFHCGYKAFSAEAATAVFSRATLDRWGFDLEIFGLAQRAGLRIREVPIAWKDDGRSRVRARDFPQTAVEVARLWLSLRADAASRRGR